MGFAARNQNIAPEGLRASDFHQESATLQRLLRGLLGRREFDDS